LLELILFFGCGSDCAGKESKFMLKRVVLGVAFSILLPGLAMAGGVSYTTSGTFSDPSLFPITFTGTSVTNFVGGDPSFGLFDVGDCSKKHCRGSETFTLKIDETSPVSATADLVGRISGRVSKNGHSDLTITFTTATVTIGSTVYTIPFRHRMKLGMGNLRGSVVSTPMPEPSAGFLLGLGALGLMGLAAASGKMLSA
jgi:hypothetical protein